MRGGLKHGRSRARTKFATLGARLSLLAVLVTLVAQTFSFGAHAARAADDARAASVALGKIVGAPVWVCVQDDGAPQTPDCHDSCPLCQLAAQAQALTPAAAPVGPAAPTPRFAAPPVPALLLRPAAKPVGFAFARGPPLSL